MGIRRRNEEEYAPTPLSVGLGAVVGLALGFFLAGFNLAAVPPVVVSELPSDADRKPGVVYFVRGSDRDGGTWKTSRDRLVEGSGTVAVTEGELNVWARTQFKPEHAQTDGGGLTVQIQPDPPGFRVLENELEVSSVVRVNAFGMANAFQYQARGTFEERGGRWVYVPREAYLGSCPVPAFAGLARHFQGLLAKSFSTHEEYVQVTNAWERLQGVRVADGRLELLR